MSYPPASGPYPESDPRYPGSQYPNPQYPNPQYPGQYPTPPPSGSLPPEVAARAAKTKRTGQWLTWAGAATMLICLVAGILVSVSSIRGLAQQSDDAIEISPTAQITVTEGQAMQLYAPFYSTPTCRFSGPAEPAPGPNQTSSFTYEGVQVESFDSVRFTEAGTYRIVCDRRAIIAPPLSIGGIFSTIGGILLAIFGGGAGLILAIVGIVLWVTGARKSR